MDEGVEHPSLSNQRVERDFAMAGRYIPKLNPHMVKTMRLIKALAIVMCSGSLLSCGQSAKPQSKPVNTDVAATQPTDLSIPPYRLGMSLDDLASIGPAPAAAGDDVYTWAEGELDIAGRQIESGEAKVEEGRTVRFRFVFSTPEHKIGQLIAYDTAQKWLRAKFGRGTVTNHDSDGKRYGEEGWRERLNAGIGGTQPDFRKTEWISDDACLRLRWGDDASVPEIVLSSRP